MPASITLTVSHLPSSTSFFLSCLQPLNYVYRGRVNNTIGFGYPDAPPDFWITQSVPGVPPGPAHVAFPALSQRHVHEFFENGLRAGGKVHGEPALRDIASGYYCAAIIDLDGNSIEAVYRADLADTNNENIANAAKSVVSMTRSTTKSKAPTAVSSTTRASKAKTVAASEVRSAAASTTARSTASKAPSQAKSVAPGTSVSRASTQARSVAPPASSASRAPTQFQSVAPSNPHRGDVIDNLLSDAKGTIAMAKQIVDQARPHMVSSDAARSNASPDSHGPSDAIVGTLLGVAAGAALHYAFSNRNRDDGTASAPASSRDSPPSGVARSETAPSYTEERYYYYHGQPQNQHVIEAPPSSYRGSQRLIEMVDNDPTISEYTSTARLRPRRRSSASEISTSKTVTTKASRATKLMLEAPPTSYRAPTASTQITHSKPTRSRASSVTRIPATILRQDEGYASASESRKSHRRPSRSEAPSRASSQSRRNSVVTAIKSPSQYPLPPSRAATWTGDTKDKSRSNSKSISPSSSSSFFSTHSKPSKTVIGKLTEKQLHKLESSRGGNLDGVTGSIVGKVKEVDGLRVDDREIRPCDSVSQVSSSRGSRRR